MGDGSDLALDSLKDALKILDDIGIPKPNYTIPVLGDLFGTQPIGFRIIRMLAPVELNGQFERRQSEVYDVVPDWMLAS